MACSVSHRSKTCVSILPDAPSPWEPTQSQERGEQPAPWWAGGIGGKRGFLPLFQGICPPSSSLDWKLLSFSSPVDCGPHSPPNASSWLMAPAPCPSPGSPTLQGLWVDRGLCPVPSCHCLLQTTISICAMQLPFNSPGLG